MMASLPPPPTSFHPLAPTLPTLPSHVKEELCSSALPSPTSQQPREAGIAIAVGRIAGLFALLLVTLCYGVACRDQGPWNGLVL